MAELTFIDKIGLSQLLSKLKKEIKKADRRSLESIQDRLSIKGFEEANQGQILAKDETEGVVWIDPLSDTSLQSAVNAASDSADRAGQSAVVAGNYAASAIQSAASVENKFWYGTIDEYNALETVSNSTIYIILHE